MVYYHIAAFGRNLSLELLPKSDFLPTQVTVEYMGANESSHFIRHKDGLHRHCFYTGSVTGDPYSVVAVSLCNGMVCSVLNV